MEFLLYLTPIGHEIINRVRMKHYHVVENAPMCRKGDAFGLRDTPNFTICTNNIKKYDANSTSFYVNETVYHEATHVAQECKGKPLGIANIHLSDNKKNDVMNSVSKYNPTGKITEIEAYYLEDKPEQVLYYLKKFCF